MVISEWAANCRILQATSVKSCRRGWLSSQRLLSPVVIVYSPGASIPRVARGANPEARDCDETGAGGEERHNHGGE